MSIFITYLIRNHPPEHRCFGGLGHVIGKAPMEHVGDKHQIKDMMIRYLSTLSSAMSSKKWVYFSFKFHALRWKPDAIRPVVLHAGECQPELVAGRSGPAFQVPPTSQCCPACTLRFQLFSQFRIREITKDFKFKNAAWSNTSYRSFLGQNVARWLVVLPNMHHRSAVWSLYQCQAPKAGYFIWSRPFKTYVNLSEFPCSGWAWPLQHVRCWLR